MPFLRHNKSIYRYPGIEQKEAPQNFNKILDFQVPNSFIWYGLLVLLNTVKNSRFAEAGFSFKVQILQQRVIWVKTAKSLV